MTELVFYQFSQLRSLFGRQVDSHIFGVIEEWQNLIPPNYPIVNHWSSTTLAVSARPHAYFANPATSGDDASGIQRGSQNGLKRCVSLVAQQFRDLR